jgi:predicted GTPase
MVRQVAESQKMVLVMGLTGSGKSSFINMLPRVGNVNAVVGHGLDSCTHSVSA